MMIYLIILFALAVVYVLLPKKHRLWILLAVCILIYHFLKYKLFKIPDWLTNFFGGKSSKYLKEIKKIKEQYINENDIKDVPRSKSIDYIESVLKDFDK